ncbi:Zn-dependent hydrolase [Halomonas denitrificans]|uniref:Zn-dependent hydrolase n=1 Tax=Halomonas TaxID=2745 RepID=UPI001C952A40|nr:MULTISPECIES: Zn-dependent hydrolase [Halomonas]MBY6206214.1 Zn-dependent hydrolase [Halomonas sp. DP3Y7-2]MBY6227895.1 Zn-dependent hydrolase [Halomonas sp. DP3Y7-1]MCA0915962.1 Zn-dependent hydrolase [Halomonas denitrificans]MCA0974266.1 Zn-dependent hydrolase [Halomonas denitrificans]
MSAELRVDGERLWQRLQTLGEVGGLPGGGVCRLALTEEDRLGRDKVMSWMHELGLEVHQDAIGNVFGLRAGREAGAPVMTGSHIDTVRTGGVYDGNLGVLAGLEVVETLNRAGLQTRRPLCVAFFTNEEGARFAPDMMGSLVYVGGMTLEQALTTRGIDGESVADCLDRIGAAGQHPVGQPDVHAFVELHVEQGPVLERQGITIGAVEQVQGISWAEYRFTGRSNHAGTTPMDMRQDAGFAAMDTASYVRRRVSEAGGHQVGTVGRMSLTPDLVNVVPQTACMTVDLRNTDDRVLTQVEADVERHARELAKQEGLLFERHTLARFAPVDFDPGVVELVENTARRLGHSVRRMPSGAGHDAQMLARVCPTAMIFVPSVGGISHNIEEYTAMEDITAGANVLLQVLLELAQTP